MAVKATEFIGERAQMYGDTHRQFPNARAEEIAINMRYLKPQEGETILEIGSGSGLYSKVLSEIIKNTGVLFATDPSKDQLAHIEALKLPNIQIVPVGADKLLKDTAMLEKRGSFDALWSLGAFHHCLDKSTAFENFAELLKPNGRILICDVLSSSQLAKYFDIEVARYSMTGHEVAFLSHEFSSSLCYLYGFTEPTFYDLHYPWIFDSQEDIGLFMYLIHGMNGTTPARCLDKVKEFMEVEYRNGKYILHVPLTILETHKVK
jgi:arsenite methyltransferase